jgi:hypothetical protein
MKKIIATLALILAAGTAQAQDKRDAPRDMYMCYTAQHVIFEISGIERHAEFRDNLKEIYNFKQERLDITYNNFKTQYKLMGDWVNEPQKLGLPANYCWKRPI